VIHGAHGFEALGRRLLAELDRKDEDPRLRELCLIATQALLVELAVFVTRVAIEEESRAARAPDLRKGLAWLPTRLADPPSPGEMAEHVGLSPAHLAVVCKRELGRTPHEHVTELRLAEAARRLRETDAPVTVIALDLGFASSQYFAAVFKRTRGVTPSEWRGRG
jgi:AraC-like DNA-binding protein